MGMDSYIYKSSKENFEKYNKHKLKVKELHDKASSFIDSLRKKKENLETIINALKTNPTFSEGNMWDSQDTVYAIKCFTQLLDNYSDDVVITYYSWY